MDVVYVPFPTSLHVRWVVTAAKKKKHVLVEKSATLDAAELDRILEACESNVVQFMDGSMWLHHPRTAHMEHFLSLSHFQSIWPIQIKMTMRQLTKQLSYATRAAPTWLAHFSWRKFWRKNLTVMSQRESEDRCSDCMLGSLLKCTFCYES